MQAHHWFLRYTHRDLDILSTERVLHTNEIENQIRNPPNCAQDARITNVDTVRIRRGLQQLFSPKWYLLAVFEFILNLIYSVL